MSLNTGALVLRSWTSAAKLKDFGLTDILVISTYPFVCFKSVATTTLNEHMDFPLLSYDVLTSCHALSHFVGNDGFEAPISILLLSKNDV